MKLFKNKVGRHTNEFKKRKNILKVSIFLFVLVICLVLSFSLSKISTKKLNGAVASAALELADYKIFEEEENYNIKNFKKIGDNYYVFVRQSVNSSYKYYLIKLNEDYTLSDTKLELEKAQVNEYSYDYLDLEEKVYVTEDNKLIVVGEYYIYKYTINENSLSKESQSEKVFEDGRIYYLNYSNDKVIVCRSYSNKYIIKNYSLDSNILSSEIEYNIDSTESSTYDIDIEQIILNEEGNYELLLSYKNRNDNSIDKLKIETINSSGSILNSNEINNSELELEEADEYFIVKIDNNKFEFIILGPVEDDNGCYEMYKYVSINGDDVVTKDIEVNADEFLEEEYDLYEGYIRNVYKEGENTIFTVGFSAEESINESDSEIVENVLVTIKLDSEGNIISKSKYEIGNIDDDLEAIGYDYAFYSSGKILVPFWANDEEVNGYAVLNYEEKYNLGIETPSNGTVTLTGSDTSFKNGDSVSFTVTPNEGYEIKSIKVLDESNNDITESVNLNLTNNTFNMPNKNVKLQVEFEAISSDVSSTSSSSQVDNSTVSDDSDNPYTYDDVVKYIIIGVISLAIVGLSVVVVIKNKKK